MRLSVCVYMYVYVFVFHWNSFSYDIIIIDDCIRMFTVIGRHLKKQSKAKHNNTLEFGQFCDGWAHTRARA